MITNILWADVKMIIDYGHFGDFVSFDTTYKTNNASRPFAVFVQAFAESLVALHRNAYTSLK